MISIFEATHVFSNLNIKVNSLPRGALNQSMYVCNRRLLKSTTTYSYICMYIYVNISYCYNRILEGWAKKSCY